MCVFRQARRVQRSRDVVRALEADLERVVAAPPESTRRQQETIHALIRAGELESAFADAAAESPDMARAAEGAARITDAAADDLVNRSAERLGPACVEALLSTSEIPEQVRVSPHEGFAYYALHPMAFAETVCEAAPPSSHAVVVGIRSIGATLSAVAAAQLRALGIHARRLTVRPAGHPYARSLLLEGEARRLVLDANDQGAAFFVADEGPGLSGSSFLATGEALTACGVPSHRVTFLCSHSVEPTTLLAANAGARWSAFRTVACASPAHVPCGVGECLVGDGWRKRSYEDPSSWPGTWTQFERLKFVSPDGAGVLKFEGLGPYGAEALRRAQALYEDGWAPEPVGAADGFITYPLAGSPLGCEQCSASILDVLARYCASRTRLFPAERCDHGELAAMVRANVREEFGRAIPASWIPAVERPVIADAHMQPHEWVRSPTDTMVKVDGVAHGDDHFFPGWTDIAWDLAGTIIEWALDRSQSEWFLTRYRRASGDDARARLGPYLQAYSVFRMAYSKMAATAVGPGLEFERLARAYWRYRALACETLGPLSVG